MKLTLFLISFLYLNINCIAQKEANQWFFEQFNGLDFNGDSAIWLDSCVLGPNESSSSICDKNGKVLFYSNGITLYNKYHKVVKNGTDLGFPISPNESSSNQGAVIVKHPENDSLIYLFSSDYQGKTGGLVYSIVKLNRNSDSGEVIIKKIKLSNSINEPIIVVNKFNGKDKWIIVHEVGNNKFKLFLLKKDGLNICPLIITNGFFHTNNAQVSMKVSSDGKYIVHSDYNLGIFEILKIDDKNNFTNFITIYNDYPSFFEFSPNSKFLFLSYMDSVVQLELNTKKRKKLAFNNINFRQMQTSINGKIYVVSFSSKELYEINSPNDTNFNIIVKNNILKNNTITALPNFNQSYFYTPSINYSYEMNCINNSIQFEGYDTIGAVTHQWQTKKLYSVNNYTSIANTKNTTHQFVDTGTYIVRYIADNGNRKDTVEKIITLYPKIKKDFLGKDTTIAQGSVFNIQLNSPQPSHCQEWHFERLNTQINKGSTNNIVADSIGKYICKTTNQAFCEVTDTLIINECINNLTIPSIYRNLTDTLFTYQPFADSFVWYRNNQQIAITKQPFIKVKDTGTYRVEAAKKGHCNRSSNIFYINKLGVKHYTLNDFNIKVYPNPSNGIINIESDKNYKLKVTDLIGKTILETENQKQIELVKGVYYLRFEINGYVVTEKVIVL